jgi:hypothetical protein
LTPTSGSDVETTDRWRRESQELLAAGQQHPPGQPFTVAGRTFSRVDRPHALAGNIWARDPDTGELVLLNRAEEHAFWVWAVIEVLRHTGIRVEELLEHRSQPRSIPPAQHRRIGAAAADRAVLRHFVVVTGDRR